MSVMRRSLTDRVKASRLYEPLRDAYHVLTNPTALRRRRAVRTWYRPFFKPGDLVFDVGANHGEHSAALLRLGARVVAVEPNPMCVELLRRRFRGRQVIIESAAVGSEPGEATLHVSQSDVLSTLSEEWLESCRSQGRFSETTWENTVQVPVTTVDDLRKAHGDPTFLKIDVEGFEEHVLQGMSAMPPALCYEFNTEAIDLAIRCLERVSQLGATSFCLRNGDGESEAPTDWISAEETKRRLQSFSDEVHGQFGDVFAVIQPPSKRRMEK